MNTRITQAAKNWGAALAIVAIYAGMQMLDLGASDHQAQLDQAADVAAATKAAAQQARYERAADQICGNGDWSIDAHNVLRCYTRKPRGAGVVLTKMEAL